MGKHERAIVEEAEIIAATLINNEDLSSIQKKHQFLNLIKSFVKVIKLEYKNISRAVAVGNSYDSPGDIRLELKDGKKRFIELKFLEKNGSGTLANISQDAMTSLGIFDCQSWSSFREKTKHRQAVIDSLNKFKYPFGVILVADSESKIHKAASYLKEVINAGTRGVEGVCRDHLKTIKSSHDQRLASEIILEIIKMDKASRVKYLSILKSANLNKERLKNFVFLLSTGSHTQEDLAAEINTNFISLVAGDVNYDVYYLYKETLTIKKEEGLNNLHEMFDRDIDIDIKESETSFVIFSKKGSERINLIRVVYHWKNKFGGIQTPCLNIFKS